MWIMTRHGFASVVEHREEPRWLLLRCRMRHHALAYADLLRLPRNGVITDHSADYPFRLTITRKQYNHLLVIVSGQIDYDNFKSSIDSKRESKYLSALHEIWFVTAQKLGIGKRSIYREHVQRENLW